MHEASLAEIADISDNVFISNYRLYTRTEVLESEDGPPAIIPAGFGASEVAAQRQAGSRLGNSGSAAGDVGSPAETSDSPQ